MAPAIDPRRAFRSRLLLGTFALMAAACNPCWSSGWRPPECSRTESNTPSSGRQPAEGATENPAPRTAFCYARQAPDRNTVDAGRCQYATDDVTSADLALYVVGPNHGKQTVTGSPLTIGDAKFLAQRIRSSWIGDPAKLVVAISDASGCPNCGWALTTSAAIIKDELARAYNTIFELRIALPEPATEYTAMPAIIVGKGWHMDSVPFKQELPAPPFRWKGGRPVKNHYGHVVLRSVASAEGTIDMFITHDWIVEEGDSPAGPAQNFDLLIREARANKSGAATSLIVGDFNAYLSTDGVGWINDIRTHAYWFSMFNECSYPTPRESRTAEMFNDIMNVVEYAHPESPTRLRPFAYAYDAAADGTPLYAERGMTAGDVQHSIIGVLFRVEPQTSPKHCVDRRCQTIPCSCKPNCSGKCNGAADGCGGVCNNCPTGWECKGAICRQEDPQCVQDCTAVLDGCNADCSTRPTPGCQDRCKSAAKLCRQGC